MLLYCAGVRLSTASSDKHAEALRMCINPLPITNLLTHVLRKPGSAAAMTSTRPSTLKAHEVALRNKKGREVLMMDLKASPPAAPLMLTS